jgi:hypothetical protein
MRICVSCEVLCSDNHFVIANNDPNKMSIIQGVLDVFDLIPNFFGCLYIMCEIW